MKVRDLIRFLSECNGDAEVTLHHPNGNNLLFVSPLRDSSKVFLEDLSDIDAKNLINERYKMVNDDGDSEGEIAAGLITANFELLSIGFPYEIIRECLNEDEEKIDYLNIAYSYWWNENHTVKFTNWTPSFDKEKWLTKPVKDRELTIVADNAVENEYLNDFISSSSISAIKLKFIEDIPEEKNDGHTGAIRIDIIRRLLGNLYTQDTQIEESDVMRSIIVYFNIDEYPAAYDDPFTFMNAAFSAARININIACENTKFTFHGYVFDVDAETEE